MSLAGGLHIHAYFEKKKKRKVLSEGRNKQGKVKVEGTSYQVLRFSTCTGKYLTWDKLLVLADIHSYSYDFKICYGVHEDNQVAT